MSQENVEVVRAMWATFIEGGFPAEALSADVEWHTAADLPEGGSGSEPLRGPGQVARMLADGWGTYEVADGRVCRVHEFRTRDEALEAVGRAENDMPADP